MSFRHICRQNRPLSDAEWRFFIEMVNSLAIGRGLDKEPCECDVDGKGRVAIAEVVVGPDCTLKLTASTLDKSDGGFVAYRPDGQIHPAPIVLAEPGKGAPLLIQRTPRKRPHTIFCNTRGEPYDIYVVAILGALLISAPTAITFFSSSALEQLEDGFALLSRKLETPSRFGRDRDTGSLWVRPIGAAEYTGQRGAWAQAAS